MSSIILAITILIIVRLFYLQIIHGKKYDLLANRQYVTDTNQVFDRGIIYAIQKDGTRVSLASVRSGFKLVINPKLINSTKNVYEKINNVIPFDEKLFTTAVSKNTSYVELLDRLTNDQAEAISASKLPGVSLYRTNWRWYPTEDLASRAIGFMAYRGDDFTGRYGLERVYNTVLGRTDKRLYVNFFAEVFSDIGKLLGPEENLEGDIVTTFEPSVQKNLELMVTSIQEKWNSDKVGGIVMNPKTGDIYAMSLDHEFDLNQSRTITDVSRFNNPLVENLYEVGSIMKPIIMAIALDQDAVTPTTSYFDQGFVKVGDRTIWNFDKRGRGQVNMQTVLNQSLNTGMVFVMQQMNKANFRDQWLEFGFGQKTGIDLPAEALGLISNIKTNRDVEFANISFGQGVAATPIAMIRALGVLANNGSLVTPRTVGTIEYENSFSKKIPPVISSPILRPETIATITGMMVKVFDAYNDGKYSIPHYAIAAKTGTAQIANPNGGGYYTDRNLHTFMGYFPAYNPQFIIFLFNEYPKNGARFASETLLPPFVDFAKFLINYYDLPPDR